MTRRRPTLVIAAALAAALASGVSAQADTIVNYNLTNTNASGSAPLTQILAEVSPIGAFDTTSSTTPLVTPAADQQFGLTASFGNGTIPAGNPGAGAPLQVLQLDFAGAGLQPGGSLPFGLRLAPAFQGGPPTLTPVTAGVSIPAGVISSSNSSTTTIAPVDVVASQSTTISTPEPLSLLVWSTLVALGLFRARSVRRGRGRMG